jgi:hypothetical protein
MSVPVWGVTLSGPLPVVGLVSHYLTNYLMGRSPLVSPRRFLHNYLIIVNICGISSPFELLSPAKRQVCYVLLTRSPLCIATSFDLHVLGTPPAFILSQDQTLRILCPEGQHHSPQTVMTGSCLFVDLTSTCRHQQFTSFVFDSAVLSACLSLFSC